MEILNSGNMQYVRWGKVSALAMLLMLSRTMDAQFNAYNFDQKYSNSTMHFGILMGYNRSEFRIKPSAQFQLSDSIAGIQSTRAPGFNLGIISNLRLGNNFDLRFLPSMTFADRSLNYPMFSDTTLNQSIESINVDLPLLIKFKSQPYKDMRLYVLGGIKYSYDLASNAKARNAENIVKIGRSDLAAEYGIGVEFYFQYFIFAPEIRISQGLINVHARDNHLQFSRVIVKLLTRSIVIVFNFEG